MLSARSQYPLFMNHPFWDFFRIGTNPDKYELLKGLKTEERYELLKAAVGGFYPVSYMSLLSFKKFSELTQYKDSREIAERIYLTEKGDLPLIAGSEFEGIKHCDQLKIMFESLLNMKFELPPPENYDLVKAVDIEHATLTKSMAICDIIENTAPYVIHFYQDLLVQCQVAFNISSEGIKRTYLDEHNLTEGAACEEQHIEMVTKMKLRYAELENSEEYATAGKDFCLEVNNHFDASLGRMNEVMK